MRKKIEVMGQVGDEEITTVIRCPGEGLIAEEHAEEVKKDA